MDDFSVGIREYRMKVIEPFLYSTGDDQDAILQIDFDLAMRWTKAWLAFVQLQNELDTALDGENVRFS